MLATVSIVASVTILVGCGTQSGPESPQVGSQPAGVELPTERPAFLDVLAAATLADEPLPPGEPLPELTVDGWINGPPSGAAGAAGSILVVECWAYW
jgi:hypothetical protein